MKELLKNLCLLNGISGDEGRVREFIISQIKDHAQLTVDPLGNLIAFCKGKPSKNRVLVSAHMDEVGLIVTYINSDGTLKFDCVGGVDPKVVFAKRVRVGDQSVLGVIAHKAVHNISKDERIKTVPFENLVIDIGCESREQAEKLVRQGDSVHFVSEFLEFGDGFVKCKAIDDRAGCAMMIKLIQDRPEYDTYFTFVVQEEIGLRGATTASYSVDPDFAFVLEESLSEIFDIIHSHRLKVSLIQSSAVTISVCVDNTRFVPEAIKALQQHFNVNYNENLSLLTIRGTTPEILERAKAGREIMLSQTTRRTARLVVKD